MTMKKIAAITLAMALSVLFGMTVAASPAHGDISSIGGTGGHGAWDNGLSQFNLPMAIHAMGNGQIIVADTFNNLIRNIDEDGETSVLAGVLHEVGGDNFPVGAYRDGEAAQAGFSRPTGLASNSEGWIFVADSQNHSIRAIIDGHVHTFAGNGVPGHTDGNGINASFNSPGAVAMGPDGNLYVADTGNHAVRMISPTGEATTIAGRPGQFGHRDGRNANSLFDSPMGIAVAEDGRVFVADTGNHLIRVIENGQVATFAGAFLQDGGNSSGGFEDGHGAMFSQPVGLAFWGEYLLVADSVNHALRVLSPDGHAATLAGTGWPGYASAPGAASEFHFPMGVSVHGDILYVADTNNNLVRVMELMLAGE